MVDTTFRADRETLSAAFSLVFRQGRAPPSCPSPCESELLNFIRDRVPAASPAACRDALIRVRKLSKDVYTVCDQFREGLFGSGDTAQVAAMKALMEKNPGFSEEEYRVAFSVGMMWTAF
ncbi:MAG: hypothetical protein MUC66_04170 [Methanolinea sp.]|jgi:hypothetical protein|nr:hypothetical protein [Methanolinea sp.]